jgi:hypothetical protein
MFRITNIFLLELFYCELKIATSVLNDCYHQMLMVENRPSYMHNFGNSLCISLASSSNEKRRRLHHFHFCYLTASYTKKCAENIPTRK